MTYHVQFIPAKRGVLEICYNPLAMETKSFFLGIVAAALILVISVGGYLLGKGASNTGGSDSISTQSIDGSLSSPGTNEQTPTITPSSPQASEDNLEAVVVSKNYAALEGVMANPVSVRLEATECCGLLAPEEAVEQMDYLNNATGIWDFSESEITQGLAASYPENYGNAIIGISSDNYVVAFQLNQSGQISKISIAANYKLLLP